MAHVNGPGRLFAIVLPFAFLTTLCIALADDPKPLTGDEVRKLQSAYRTEHDQTETSGAAGKFTPRALQRAKELGRQGDAALEAGQLDEAAQNYREARWLLPGLPPGFPDHVARVFGNLRLRHGAAVQSLAYSPDGQRLASASRDQTVKVWSLATGREIICYRGHKE